MYLRGCFLIALVCVAQRAAAQAPYLYFSRISTQNGLSNAKVNCILEDKRGFLWIGTDDGLNRYDGHYFTIFRNQPGNSASLSGNIVSGMVEDREGLLWITTTDGGLSRYDYRLPPASQFRQYRHDPSDSNSLPVNIVNTVVEDNEGYLWLATDGRSVVRFNKSTGKCDNPISGGTRNAIALCLDRTGILWVGRQGGGLLKINTSDLTYQTDARYANLYANLPHVTVTSLYRDRNNDMWFGSWDKHLYRYSDSSGAEHAFVPGTSSSSFPGDDVSAFAEDRSGMLWIGGRYNGLTIFNRKAGEFFNYRYDPAKDGTISDNRVNCINISRNGLVWIGTNKGLSLYDPSQQPFVQQFVGSGDNIAIYDFFRDKSGKLWIGTSQGLYVRDSDHQPFRHISVIYKNQKLAVSKFFRDGDGTMYLGTDYSLFIFDEKTERCSLLPNTEKDPVIYKIIQSRIVSIIKDSIGGHPVLLVSPYGHFIAYYDFVKKHWVSRVDSVQKIVEKFNLRDNLIRRFYKTSQGRVWLATVKSGLGEWMDHSRPVLQYFRSDNNPNIYDMTEDGTGNLWVSTYGGGLYFFDVNNSAFQHVDLSNNLVEGLERDAANNVWMISNGHLHRYDPKLKTFRTYLLPDLEKSGGVHGYIYKDDEGKLYVAGNNYFISFLPESLTTTSQEPVVYLTDFRIFSSSYSHLLANKHITLGHDQNYFTFEFSAPSFAGGNVDYSYKLDGVDKDWIKARDLNFASYSNLSGGDYVFHVRTTDKNGNSSDNAASIDITIVPPFWKTWYFAGLMVLAVSAIIYAVYRYRINEILKREAIRNRIAQDLHDNVGSTLSSISVYSQVAKIYRDQQKEQALGDTLERISSTSSEMISEMNDIVWAINPRNDHMAVIVQRMESYAKPLLQARNISFDFQYDPAIEDLNLQMEQRNNFYLIFKEAVNNALKYSECRHLSVALSIRHRMIELVVKDDGKGFNMQKIAAEASRSMSGNGLNNMKRRAAAMKGQCSLTSEPGKGTTVILEFPIT